VTPINSSYPASGLGDATIDQVVPSQCSISEMVPWRPTAQQSDAEVQATLAKTAGDVLVFVFGELRIAPPRAALIDAAASIGDFDCRPVPFAANAGENEMVASTRPAMPKASPTVVRIA
jgi:hypothetical protein